MVDSNDDDGDDGDDEEAKKYTTNCLPTNIRMLVFWRSPLGFGKGFTLKQEKSTMERKRTPSVNT